MMTLGSMRENGVRSLAIACGAVRCNHQAVLDADAFADDITVPSFGPRGLHGVRRYRCGCAATGTNVRPPVCLAYTPNFGFFPRGDACFKPKPQQSATNVYATKQEKATRQRV